MSLTPARAKELANMRNPKNMKRNVDYANLARLRWEKVKRANTASQTPEKPCDVAPGSHDLKLVHTTA